MKKNRKTELKVFFDTNVLYTQTASDLLRTEVAELIKSVPQDPTFQISWHLPEIVIKEREYQMVSRSIELLPSLNKLERVMGHNLGITEDILRERIKSTIARQLTSFGINTVILDYEKVDWHSMVTAAVERGAPFEAGQKEKGFRDALAVEAFLQLVDKSPKTSSVCRLALVSGDILIRQALAERTKSMANVRILEDLDELNSLINTLASEVSVEYVEELRDKAKQLFFIDSEKKDTLYYTENIYSKLRSKFEEELGVKDSNVKTLAIRIALPKFISKNNFTISWESRITYEQEVKDSNLDTATTNSTSAAASMNALQQLLQTNTPNQATDKRTLVFVSGWSCRVNTRKQLSAPKLGELVLLHNSSDQKLVESKSTPA